MAPFRLKDTLMQGIRALIYTKNQVRKILTWFLVVYGERFRELVLLTILKKGNIINYKQILDSYFYVFHNGNQMIWRGFVANLQ